MEAAAGEGVVLSKYRSSHIIAAFAFFTSLVLSLVALLSNGWMKCKYEANVASVQYSALADYGLWIIKFKSTTTFIGTTTYKADVPYDNWAGNEGVAFKSVQVTRAFLILSIISKALAFAFYSGGFYTSSSARTQALHQASMLLVSFDILLLFIDLVVWGALSKDSFNQFCTSSSCQPVQYNSVRFGYCWYLVLAAALLNFLFDLGVARAIKVKSKGEISLLGGTHHHNPTPAISANVQSV